jgi:hypothetical protein
MSRYYAGSKPVNWLRKKLNIEKPTALGWGEWDTWDNELKAGRPIAFFFTETLPSVLEWFPKTFIDPINDIRYYFVNRFVDKTHYLRTGLKPGQWHEFQHRVLHGCFEELIDFVEQEKASHHMAWSNTENRDKYKYPWWARVWVFKWGRWRSPESGVAHLQWEITLDEPDESGQPGSSAQAETARETLALYQWWKFVRPQREDAWTATGFRKFWDDMDTKYGDGNWLGLSGKKVLTTYEDRKYHKLSKAADALEEARHDEDEEMLIRLVKIRRNLWT